MKKVLYAILMMLVSIGCVYFAVICIATVFRIRTIEIVGDQATIEINKKTFSGNILFFPISSTVQTLKESNSLIESVTIVKKYPGTLRITVTKRKPIAILVSDNVQYGIDKDGFIVPDHPVSGSTEIELSIPSLRIGKRVDDNRVQQALYILETLKDLGSISKITSYDSSSLRVIFEKVNIYITQDGDMQTVVASLQKLITGFRIKGTTPKTIDVRFSKPIVTF